MKTTIATRINNMLSPTGSTTHATSGTLAHIAFATGGNETPPPPQTLGSSAMIDPSSLTAASLGFVDGTLSSNTGGHMIDTPGSLTTISLTSTSDGHSGIGLAFHN